ncbi:hypothetical protein DUNSADRAFT_17506 [Dunaliella salina]|uniref:Uncharacterized protein n=1 Tax=Dunaliella salina TaxID=3046 RepID=A0ABQ7GZX3_DUNSA|nr:hypothetical protein DUNSADRAFT_17506 [Dunaliella salina]|eukprot:KAF5840159.1 hypothetical protein DUNSADRAFT_17506 [Dunaliella salina]
MFSESPATPGNCYQHHHQHQPIDLLIPAHQQLLPSQPLATPLPLFPSTLEGNQAPLSGGKRVPSLLHDIDSAVTPQHAADVLYKHGKALADQLLV